MGLGISQSDSRLEKAFFKNVKKLLICESDKHLVVATACATTMFLEKNAALASMLTELANVLGLGHCVRAEAAMAQ